MTRGAATCRPGEAERVQRVDRASGSRQRRDVAMGLRYCRHRPRRCGHGRRGARAPPASRGWPGAFELARRARPAPTCPTHQRFEVAARGVGASNWARRARLRCPLRRHQWFEVRRRDVEHAKVKGRSDIAPASPTWHGRDPRRRGQLRGAATLGRRQPGRSLRGGRNPRRPLQGAPQSKHPSRPLRPRSGHQPMHEVHG